MSVLVSIVIPCYNPGAWLLEAVASARAQTHTQVEVILVNDGTDQPDSRTLLDQAARQVDLYLEQPNRGLPAARNAGFRAAHGLYVVPLDADDLIQPEYVAACLSAGKPDPCEAAFTYTDCCVFGTQNYLYQLSEYNLYSLLDRNFLTYAALIRKDEWEQAGGYDKSMRHGYEDWEFWLRLGARKRFGRHVPRPLFKYRKRGPSLYDVALGRHAELVAYIRSKHPELYEDDARARIKGQWSPAVCMVAPAAFRPQSILDVQVVGPADSLPPVETSPAEAFLLCAAGGVDAHSAELAALAVWGGRAETRLPDGSLALSRRAAARTGENRGTGRDQPRPAKERARAPALPSWRALRRHLANAELLSLHSWLKHPWRSALRLVPLRVKERINQAAGRTVFDLSFYLQFRPNSLMTETALAEPLRYCPQPAAGRFRVALLTPHLGPGGAEQVLRDIASALGREHFEILLLATQSRDDRWSGRWRECVEHVYDLAGLIPPVRMSAAVCSMVSNWKCDAVLVQNSLYGYAALPHIRLASPATRLIDLIHASDDRWDQVSVTAAVDAHLDLRVAVSDALRRRLLASGTPAGKIRLVRNGVDLDRFHASPVRAHADPKRILFVGRLDPVKRPLLLPAIARQLAGLRKTRDFRFVVAGDGPDKEPLQAGVRRARLKSAFEILGHVDDVAPLLRAADIVVLPSRAEGIPLAVLEALASSRPVVASNVGAVGEAVDSNCGVLIESGPGEIAVFAAALDCLLNDSDLRDRMGKAGRQKMELLFDRRRAREEYVSLFAG